MAELMGNKAIEDAAIKWIGELERAPGRLAEATRYAGSAGDVESPPRVSSRSRPRVGRVEAMISGWRRTRSRHDYGHKLAGLPPGRRAVRLRQASGVAPQHRVRSGAIPEPTGSQRSSRHGMESAIGLALDASGLISGGCPRVSWNLRCGPISSRYTVK